MDASNLKENSDGPDPLPVSAPKLAILIVAAIAAMLLLIVVHILFGLSMVVATDSLISDHFVAIVGLPCAAAFSFLLVLLLPQAYGPIEFKALGISLKGASGPVVLWLIVFSAIVMAIKSVW